MIFSGRTRTQVRGSVLTHLTSRDGVPHVRPGKCLFIWSPNAGTGFREGKSGRFFSRVVDQD